MNIALNKKQNQSPFPPLVSKVVEFFEVFNFSTENRRSIRIPDKLPIVPETTVSS